MILFKFTRRSALWGPNRRVDLDTCPTLGHPSRLPAPIPL